MNSSRSQSSPRTLLMSRENLKKSFLPDQTPLFGDAQPAEGSLNDEAVIRSIITECIRKCSKSREEIVGDMSTLLGDKVTVRMLNSYTSEAAEEHRWPMQYTRAFCYVVQDFDLLRCIAERAGFFLITEAEAELLEIGREYLRQKRAAERISLLEKGLQGVDL